MRVDHSGPRIWPVPISRIEQVVSAHLGPGRIPGNAQGPCFSRQVSMYLAKHVGGWSLGKIGRFYNGRHHTTVLHAIEKIESLRNKEEAIDALIDVFTTALSPNAQTAVSVDRQPPPRSALIEAVAAQVIDRLAQMQQDNGPKMGYGTKAATANVINSGFKRTVRIPGAG
jgi:hypothetical protein